MRISDWSSDVCSSDLWETLRATGLTHLIAISGFHVGMVAALFALLGVGLWRMFPALARRLPRPQAAALAALVGAAGYAARSGEHTSEHQSLMRSSYAVFCLRKKIASTQPLFADRRRLASTTGDRDTPPLSTEYLSNIHTRSTRYN